MADDVRQAADFESVKRRLAEIAEAVGDESLSLDDALGLYEEAVALGLQASDLLEAGVEIAEDGSEDADDDASDVQPESEQDSAAGAVRAQA